jgi:hypothetical protein
MSQLEDAARKSPAQETPQQQRPGPGDDQPSDSDTRRPQNFEEAAPETQRREDDPS